MVGGAVKGRAIYGTAPPLSITNTDPRARRDGQPRRFVIAGIADGSLQPIGYLPRSTLDALAGDTLATTLTVATNEVSLPMQLDLVRRLRGAFDAAGRWPAASCRPRTGASSKTTW